MKFPIREATASGYILMDSGGLCDLSYPSSKNRRGRVQGGGGNLPNNNINNNWNSPINNILKTNRYGNDNIPRQG